ncbi:MAG: hypothetical protein M0P73_16275 [Syntrophobacterales bacterium]|nr:hypothetical protein [Syntrophobacterales bacterium]
MKKVLNNLVTFRFNRETGSVRDLGRNTLEVSWMTACVHLDYRGQGAGFSSGLGSKVRAAAQLLGYDLVDLRINTPWVATKGAR